MTTPLQTSCLTPRRTLRRRALALVGLALLTGSVFLADTARAGIPVADYPLPPIGSDPPPHAPPVPQDCLEAFLQGSTRCFGIWCHPVSILWIDWIDCDTGQLDNCMDKVNATYACCMDPAACVPSPRGTDP